MKSHSWRDAGRIAQIAPAFAVPEPVRDETREQGVQHRLLRLGRAIDRNMARDLKSAFNLNVAEWRVLTLVCTMGSSSAVEICAVFETDRAEVSRAVASLVKADLIRREADRSHHRKMKIMPTSAGQHMFERARAMHHASFASMMQDVPPGEHRAFKGALERIARRVRERQKGEGAA